MSKRRREGVSRSIFTFAAILVVGLIAAVFIFIGSKSYQTFTVHHINLWAFFTGTHWNPQNGQVGAAILITGSVVSTVLAVLVSTPVSVGVAIFVTEIAPLWARRFMQPVIELFAGIPSIIYGFLGLQILIPIIANVYNGAAGAYLYNGYGIIAASLILSVMILPTITTIAVDALAGLPGGLREASFALGATRWQTIRRSLLPAASSGIFTGVILGTGRAIGETLAVSFVIGSNAGHFPAQINGIPPYFHLFATSTITVQMLLDFGEIIPGSLDYDALWTLGFILLLISFLLVLVSRWISSRGAYNVSRSSSTARKPLLRRWLPGQAEPREVAG